MKLSDRFSVPPQVLDRSVRDEHVILDLESGTYYGLGGVGAGMWQLIGDGKTLGEICDALLKQYDVSREQLEGDLLKLAQELAERGLIVPR